MMAALPLHPEEYLCLQLSRCFCGCFEGDGLPLEAPHTRSVHLYSFVFRLHSVHGGNVVVPGWGVKGLSFRFLRPGAALAVDTRGVGSIGPAPREEREAQEKEDSHRLAHLPGPM